jgi:hypothetical protein
MMRSKAIEKGTCPHCGATVTNNLYLENTMDLMRILGKELGLKPKGKNIHNEPYYELGIMNKKTAILLIEKVRKLKGGKK